MNQERRAERRRRNELDEAVQVYLREQSSEALQRVLQAGEGLVHHFARLYSGGKLFEDLVQAGFEGLIHAARRFDPKREVSFVTYASHCIMGEIRHELRRQSNYQRPDWLRELQQRIYRVIEEKTAEEGVPPDLQAIAEAVNIDVAGVAQALQAGRVSFQEIDMDKIRHLRYEHFRLPIEDVIAVRQAVSRLNHLQRKVVYLIFYHDLTQTQVAKRLGLGQRKVSRILHRCLINLGKFLE